MENTKYCLHCSKNLIGRSDKKFCNYHCRSEFNNKRARKKEQHLSIKRINSILQNNREILFSLIKGKNKIKIESSCLESYGFHFNFHTHTISIKEITKVYCYDVGYIKKDEKEVVIFAN